MNLAMKDSQSNVRLRPLQPRVLHLGEGVIVLDKPAGWLTIPGRAAPGTEAPPILVDWLEQSPDSPVRGGKAWIVHRLDRETSGVIVFARTAESHRALCMAFENRETKKIYECLASGNPPLPVFKVAEPIGGVPSQSQVEVLRRSDMGFHARVRIFTGRRHQIRIHLSNRGYPIWGDVRYGGAMEIRGKVISRVALHARKLEIPGWGAFESELPGDFQTWLEELQ